MGEVRYFDPDEPVGNMSGHLPHWRQPGSTYFVTFRLGDSLPRGTLERWEGERDRWLALHPEPHTAVSRSEFYRLFTERFQRWLDAGHGSCLLARATIKRVVEDSLAFFDGVRYELGEHIVMPNHVHAIVTPLDSTELSDILQTWKSFTSHAINRITGKSGSNWQKESFDHIVRNGRQLERIGAYIRDNPKNRKQAN